MKTKTKEELLALLAYKDRVIAELQNEKELLVQELQAKGVSIPPEINN